ncbi:Protein of unknown function [Gryllus bimaculatus]|nr:Protein of unknown function [Gryllus bimaculatus]
MNSKSSSYSAPKRDFLAAGQALGFGASSIRECRCAPGAARGAGSAGGAGACAPRHRGRVRRGSVYERDCVFIRAGRLLEREICE